MAFLLAFLFLFFWNYLVYTSLLILVQIRFLTHFLFSQLIYQLRLPGDCKFFTFKCSVTVTIYKKKQNLKTALVRNKILSYSFVFIKKTNLFEASVIKIFKGNIRIFYNICSKEHHWAAACVAFLIKFN